MGLRDKPVRRSQSLFLPRTEQDLAQFDWAGLFAAEKQAKKSNFLVVDSETTIVGTFLTRAAFIHGRIEGFVMGENITVDPGGILRGIVFCRTLTVSGCVEGSVFCDKAVIKRGGTLTAQLKYNKLTIARGGIIIGNVGKRHSK